MAEGVEEVVVGAIFRYLLLITADILLPPWFLAEAAWLYRQWFEF